MAGPGYDDAELQKKLNSLFTDNINDSQVNNGNPNGVLRGLEPLWHAIYDLIRNAGDPVNPNVIMYNRILKLHYAEPGNPGQSTQVATTVRGGKKSKRRGSKRRGGKKSRKQRQ
jgi:hypothetical protein